MAPRIPTLFWSFWNSDSHKRTITVTKELTSWDLVAHPVTQVIGEQAIVDILDLSEVAWTCWGVSTPQQWAGAENGEGIRPAAGTGNE